jgi:glycerol-3-phosphate acyltransferase PlsY
VNILLYSVVSVVCYLLGSFPTAYLVVRKWAHKDVTQLGSGNIGTMNVHRATENKLLTVLVLLGDMAKGALAILLAKILLGSSPAAPIVAAASVVAGHNYSIYMGFKGGRGLATAAGTLLVFCPLVLLIWIVIWIGPFFASKILVVGTLTATLVTPVVTYVFLVTQTFGITRIDVIFTAVISFVVLLRHISKMKKLIEGSEPKKYWKIRKDH